MPPGYVADGGFGFAGADNIDMNATREIIANGLMQWKWWMTNENVLEILFGLSAKST